MRIDQVPVYNDPSDFENGTATYPCSTQYMVYNPLQHKYFLTAEALAYNGIDVERKYISSSNNKVREFIEKVTKKVYDYIQYKAGWKNFQIQVYRIAVAPQQIYQDQYTFRKQFEEALLSEARWLLVNGDSGEYSSENMENSNNSIVPPKNTFRNNSDIAKETIRTLDYLGLTKWFTMYQFRRLDTEKY